MTVIEHIDRFRIMRELARGKGVIVYLAEDPRLKQQVAIKTIDRVLSPEEGSRLREEAAMISKLRHPNIISIYEVGNVEGKPYVVHEYIEGISLRDLMDREKIMVDQKAVYLMIQILDGITHGHEMGVVHWDLNPSTIMIARNDVPKIMDFGLSVMIGTTHEVAGIPYYLTPEHFFQTSLTPQSDIFAMGMLFYEIISGSPAFMGGSDHGSLMHRIAHDPVAPPSSYNKDVHRDLDRIILKALEKKPEDRYLDAAEMKKLLEAYLYPEERVEKEKSQEMHGTVDFLMRRMHHKGDLPAFSEHIIEINTKLSSLTSISFASAGDLAKIILKDFSLTTKLLKVVNSALYAHRSGGVTTVSKALFLLGFERVRMIAATLMIFDHFQDKAQAAELQEAAMSAFMSGLIAMDVAENMKLGGKEEAFICAMLHNLGRMLVICYFPEEYAEIKDRMAQPGFNEERASKSVLGITYSMLGMTVSRSWNFPDNVVQSMEVLPPGIPESPKTEQAVLRVLSNYSNELFGSVVNAQDAERTEVLADMSKRYRTCIPLQVEQMEALIDSAVENIDSRHDIIPVNRETNIFMKKIIQSRKSQVPASDETNPAEKPQRQGPAVETAPAVVPSAAAITEQQINILTNGIHEITDIMKDKCNLSDVIYMILETMYRGLEFYRVIFCMRDASREKMVARFGLGDNADELVRHFQFRIGKFPDVFNIAISQAKGVTIDDAAAPSLIKNIPEWYRKNIAAPSFLVYPLIINGGCIGMFYADKKIKGTLLTETQRTYMEELRNLAIQAITQKHP